MNVGRNLKHGNGINECCHSFYGCCSDGYTIRQNKQGTNCYITDGCAGTRHGCCDDGYTIRTDRYGQNCGDQQYPSSTTSTTTTSTTSYLQGTKHAF